MSKIINRGLFIAGEKRKVGTYLITVMDENSTGVLRSYGASVPADTDAGFAPGSIFWKSSGGSTGSTVYLNEGSKTSADFNAVSGGGSPGGNFSLDDAYNDGASITVDALAVTFAGAHATNNVTVFSGSGSGNMIDLANTGTGKDIDGSGSTWYVTKLGAALLTGITGCDTIVAAANLSLNATGAGTIAIGNVSSGAVTITPALIATASLTITGTADATCLTVTAGDVTISNGLLSLDSDDTTTGGNLVIPSSTATTSNVISITADDLTSGAAIYIDSDNGASFASQGGYMHFTDGTNPVFHVGRYGTTTVAGNAAGTDSFVATAGDVRLTSGHLILTLGNATLTAGNLGLTSGTLTVTAGATSLTAVANSATLTVVNNTITTGNSLVEVTSSSLTTGAMMRINSTCATHDGEILELLSSAGAATTVTGLSITIPSVTTGIAKGIYVTMAGATTQATGISVDMAALTTGTGQLITTAGVMTTTGSLLTLTANAATTAAGLLRINANGLTSGIGMVIASSATALTGAGRLFLVNHTGATGNASGVVAEIASAANDETVVFRVTGSAALAAGVLVDLSAAAMTTGTALDIGGMAAITTGNGIVVAASGTTRTDGMLLSISCASTAATATGRMLLVNHTGATSTSSIIAEIKSAAADETVVFQALNSAANTGAVAVVSQLAAVTGLGLLINATQATLTTGRYLSCNDAATEVFGIGANGHIHSTVSADGPTIAVTQQNGISAAAITAGGSDTCGIITTTGTNNNGGTSILQITFGKTYTTAPKAVLLFPRNASAAKGSSTAGATIYTTAYVSATAATTFDITIPADSAATATPSWNYVVIA